MLFFLQFNATVSVAQNQIRFNQDNEDGSAFLFEDTSVNLALDTWYHLLFSWDNSGLSLVAHLYVNDVSNITISSGRPGPITWGDAFFLNMLRLTTGDGTHNLDGCISEFYLNPVEFLDFSVEANRRKFITAGLSPADLGADGSTPTGTSPKFYHTGDGVSFPVNNGTYVGTLTVHNTFIDCTDPNPS